MAWCGDVAMQLLNGLFRNQKELKKEFLGKSGHDVFISYSTKDKIIADAICHILEQNNLKCWIASRDITSGTNYSNKIINAIISAKIVVLVFSKYSQESPFVNSEISIAYSNNKPIISFKIDETMPEGDMEYNLKNKHWLEAYPEPEMHFDELIRDSLNLCDENVPDIIKYNFKDFDSKELSELKKDYLSIILLFTPIYGASFIYMGFVSHKNLWKVMGLIYLIPFAMLFMFIFDLYDFYFFSVYPIYLLCVMVFVFIWILAIIHGFLIRKEFSNRKAVLKVIKSDDELFTSLIDEYSKK